jgi:branched-chain amino acid transport system substrate-binding protein
MTRFVAARGLAAALLAIAAIAPRPLAAAELSDGIVRIGVLTDLSGPYSAIAGQGSVIAARMAIADFGGRVAGRPVELVAADHQNKPDIGSAIARQWFDADKVDVVVDLVNSAVGLAVMNIARERHKVTLLTGTITGRAVNEECSPTNIQWTNDTYALANSSADALVKRGGKSWFFITVDNAFGRSLEKDAAATVKRLGGTVVGSVAHPLDTTDFSSYLLQAQASGADVIGLANAGANTIDAVKQAAEFRIAPKQTLAALDAFLTDIHAIGLEVAQGMYVTQGFYWDLDDATRAWSKRFFAERQAMPTVQNAAIYSLVTHYLKAVEAVGSDDAAKVMAQLRSSPVKDFYARNAEIRRNGSLIHDIYLMRVKTPAASTYPWDYYAIDTVIPAAKAFPPLDASPCGLK